MQQRFPSTKENTPRLFHLLRENVQHVNLIAINGVADTVLQFSCRSIADNAIRFPFVLSNFLAVVRVQAGEAHSRFCVKSRAMLQQQLDTFDVTFQTRDMKRERAWKAIDVSVWST